MARKPKPPYATDGGGYSFEDAVATWFLLHMLSGRPPLGPALGQVLRVDWQAKENWLQDDLVLRLSGLTGDHHTAISVKSDRQVTESGWPEDFVRDAWEQWLESPSGGFQRDRDHLVLVVGELSRDVASAWNELLREAIETDPSRLVERLLTDGLASRLKRVLFESLQCPLDLRVSGGTDAVAAAHLLRRLRLVHLDFRRQPSHDLNEAHRLAREVVNSGQPEDASLL